MCLSAVWSACWVTACYQWFSSLVSQYSPHYSKTLLQLGSVGEGDYCFKMCVCSSVQGHYWDGSLCAHHCLVQLLCLQIVCDCIEHGLSTAADSLPLCIGVWCFRVTHHFLNSCVCACSCEVTPAWKIRAGRRLLAHSRHRPSAALIIVCVLCVHVHVCGKPGLVTAFLR